MSLEIKSIELNIFKITKLLNHFEVNKQSRKSRQTLEQFKKKRLLDLDFLASLQINGLVQSLYFCRSETSGVSFVVQKV